MNVFRDIVYSEKAGVVTAWFAAIVWPIAVAVFMWNEEEGAKC